MKAANTTPTAIRGIKIGHYTDARALTGCTAILCEGGAVAGVDVRGAAPGTRETDLLAGYHLVERIHAVMLSGGSAFGLNSAAGAMRYLEERGVGQDTGFAKVPIVPAAVIYDLGIGDASARPGEAEGYAACQEATCNPVAQGSVGAGTGATIGKALGPDFAAKSGLGCASVELGGGILVSALIVVNALGDVYDHRTGQQVAGASKDGKLISCYDAILRGAGGGQAGENTTIGVVVTNAALTREEANRMATMGHDGLAMAIRPVHTPFDGDTLFALSTLEIETENKLAVFTAATEAVALAVKEAATCR